MKQKSEFPSRSPRRQFLAHAMGGVAMFGVGLRSLADDRSANASWPGWRGPNRDGKVRNQLFPKSLEKVTSLWSKPMGDSYSGPILTDLSVFTTESKAGKERVYCLSRADGQLTWQYEWDGKHTVPFFAARNGSWIRSTPITDGINLYVGGIRDLLVALDCKSGREVWRIDFAKLSGKVPDFGMVCSPLIDGGHLYIQAGMAVHKIQTSDGSIVWSSMKDSGDMMTGGAFSSPVIETLNGTRQLIVQTRTKLAGLNLDTGSPLWVYEVAAFRGMNILTPTVWDNAIFTSSYGGRSLLLDVNADKATKTRWENKIEGYMSSPIVIDHYAYLHLRNKRFACLNMQTGKEEWVTTPFGEYWSMVSDGQRILALDQNGMLRLIDHNPTQFTQLSERKISEEEAWAHVAVSGDQIAVRSQNKIELFRWEP